MSIEYSSQTDLRIVLNVWKGSWYCAHARNLRKTSEFIITRKSWKFIENSKISSDYQKLDELILEEFLVQPLYKPTIFILDRNFEQMLSKLALLRDDSVKAIQFL